MGNIFATETPQPEPQRTAEYRRPIYQTPANHRIPPRNIQPENARVPQNPRCPHYTRETCIRGDNCPLLHWGDVIQRQPPQPPLNIQRPNIGRPDLKPRKPCHFFARGHCNKGAACRFSHDKNDTMTTENQDDRFNDNNTYELGGAWVKFDKGVTVSKVSFSSDYSAVSIQNLPKDSSIVSVKTLLSEVGIPTSAAEIRIMTQTEQNKCSAIVKAEDPSFAKMACSKLGTYTTLPDIKAIIISPQLPYSQSPYQVDCRKVHCAWNRPVREARLEFEDKSTAIKVYKYFRTGNYRVPGSRITASYPENQKSEGKWVVNLAGLGEATKEQDIIQSMPESGRPQNVQLGEPNYVPDPDFDSTIVKSMLLEFGLLERWEASSNLKSKRFTANATFFEESSARDATSSLHNKPLSFSETTQLSVTLVASAKFKIQSRIYDIVRPRIDKQKAIWARQYIRSFEIPLKGLYRILKLEGDNHRSMVQAKEAVEKIISGDIIRMEGKDLRCGNFRQGGKEFKKVKLIEDAFKVAIIPDIRKSQFRIFGPEACSRSVLDGITTMLQDCVPESHVIELNEADFNWASMGGLRLLKSRLGEGKVSFNITPKNKRIFIRGSKADYNNAMAIIASKQIVSFNTNSHSEMECPTCLSEAEDPIRMSCDHVYCSDCFIQMCAAEKTAIREFRICCVKDTDSNGKICQKAFSLSEIQEHLPSEEFEGILEKSFESYITRHPGGFKYCQSPDCDQVYRVTSADSERPSTFTCKKCLTSTCTTCYSSHPGKPCAGSGGNRPSALSNEMKETLGIKSCPKCTMLLEKRDGCNHLTCKCGAHVCWVCLVSFDESRHCYSHMTKVHGGYYGR